MGFLKFGKSEPPQSHIIYTDNVRRKSSFSILVSPGNNDGTNLQDVAKKIDTFEENSERSKKDGDFLYDQNGNAMIITELGANFVYQEHYDQGDGEETRSSQTHRWVVFASVFFTMAINVGFVFSFGSMFTAILDRFKESRASTAAIQSVFVGVGPSSAILTGMIAQRYGARKCGVLGSVLFSGGLLTSWFATSTIFLQVSFGIVSALGFSFLYIASNQIICQLFRGQTRLICVSLVACASGVGGLGYPNLLNWMNTYFGLNGTFLLIGAVTCNTIPLSFLWSVPLVPSKPNPVTSEDVLPSKEGSETEITDGNSKPSVSNFWTTVINTILYRPFLFLLLGIGLVLSMINMYDILAMDILSSNGLSNEQSLNAIIVSGAASIPSRMLPGLMNRINGCSSVATPVLAALFGMCGVVMVNFLTGFVGGISACVMIGLSRGGMVGTMSVVTIKVLGVKRFSTGLGLIFGITGLITTIIGPLNGFLRDISGTYKISLYMAASVMIVGGILCSISLVLHSRAKAKITRERAMSVFTVTRF